MFERRCFTAKERFMSFDDEDGKGDEKRGLLNVFVIDEMRKWKGGEVSFLYIHILHF